jgi:cytochrome c oxidase cbb3-type subunit 4
LRSIITVVFFVLFVAIVIWAYSDTSKAAFDQAARLPFDEEGDRIGMGPHAVSLLTLLGVCEELLRERRKIDGLREKIRNKSSRILEMLEGVPRADEGNSPPVGGMSI